MDHPYATSREFAVRLHRLLLPAYDRPGLCYYSDERFRVKATREELETAPNPPQPGGYENGGTDTDSPVEVTLRGVFELARGVNLSKHRCVVSWTAVVKVHHDFGLGPVANCEVSLELKSGDWMAGDETHSLKAFNVGVMEQFASEVATIVKARLDKREAEITRIYDDAYDQIASLYEPEFAETEVARAVEPDTPATSDEQEESGKEDESDEDRSGDVANAANDAAVRGPGPYRCAHSGCEKCVLLTAESLKIHARIHRPHRANSPPL